MVHILVKKLPGITSFTEIFNQKCPGCTKTLYMQLCVNNTHETLAHS